MTNDNHKALRERLRDHEWPPSRVMDLAADAIEALVRERDEARAETLAVLKREAATTKRYDDRLDKLERERDEALEALREMLSSPVIRSDQDNLEFDFRHTCFTIDKARAFLAKHEVKP